MSPGHPTAALLAHSDALLPHDLLLAWNADPLLLAAIVGAAVLHRRGRRDATDGGGRTRAFHLGLAAVAVALVSPLETLAGVLVSAHMVQHVLLVVVAAPLLAASAPGPALVRGLPGRARTRLHAVAGRGGLGPSRRRHLRSPVGRWLVYVVVLWAWHASVLYGAAVEHEAVHVAEHATFVAAAFAVWSSILGPDRVRAPDGLALLGVFALGLQTVFLSALLTFATSPWYEPYLGPTSAWGLDPLRDQQLAGAIMWVPGGLVHVGIGVALLARWLRSVDDPEPVRSSAAVP